MAEAEGFEPPDPCGSPVFKTDAFGHSATPPAASIRRLEPVWRSVWELEDPSLGSLGKGSEGRDYHEGCPRRAQRCARHAGRAVGNSRATTLPMSRGDGDRGRHPTLRLMARARASPRSLTRLSGPARRGRLVSRYKSARGGRWAARVAPRSSEPWRPARGRSGRPVAPGLADDRIAPRKSREKAQLSGSRKSLLGSEL